MVENMLENILLLYIVWKMVDLVYWLRLFLPRNGTTNIMILSFTNGRSANCELIINEYVTI